MSHRAMTAPLGKKKELVWAPNCAVYHTFHGSEYDRREFLFLFYRFEIDPSKKRREADLNSFLISLVLQVRNPRPATA